MAYNSRKTIPKHSKIYRQLHNYYHFCEYVCKMSQNTIKSKKYILNGFVIGAGLTDLRKITNQHIYDWIASQSSRNNAGRSINDRLAHLKAMLRWQQDMGLPMPRLRLGMIIKVKEIPPRKVYFTRQEVHKALQVANLDEWLMIRLAFDCGLRISELCNLHINNIKHNQLTIVGKGNKRRYAYMSEQTRQALKHWIKLTKITGYIWPSPIYQNRPIATCTIRQKMQEAFRRAGFNDFCPHDLRHSYATDLKRIGIPTRKIQAGLGHSSEAVTERYLSDLDGLDLCDVYQLKYATGDNPVENF